VVRRKRERTGAVTKSDRGGKGEEGLGGRGGLDWRP
jgi:hypothetical protein